MRSLFAALLFVAAPAFAAPAFAAPPASAPPGTAVILAARPGTPADATARQLVAQDLAEAARNGEEPLLLTGTARLGGAQPALFVQLQSPRECGSAGCSTTVFAWSGAAYRRVLDGVSGRIAVASTRHRGMADLVTDVDRYTFDGQAYRSTRPAPPVAIRR